MVQIVIDFPNHRQIIDVPGAKSIFDKYVMAQMESTEKFLDSFHIPFMAIFARVDQ